MPCSSRSTAIAAGLLGLTLLSGCTFAVNDLVLQTDFAYPSGDYAPLGQVRAEKKYTTFFTQPEMTREIFLDLRQQALANKPGADQIVDYVVQSSVTQIPLIPVAWTTFSLDGTAIKINELRDRQLRGNTIPSPTRMR